MIHEFYQDCSKCHREMLLLNLRGDAVQTFRFEGMLGHYSWNVTKATEIAAQYPGRVRIFSGAELGSLVAVAVHSHIDNDHLRHVPLRGVGVLVHTPRDGPVLIDGSHRAVRASRDGSRNLLPVFELSGNEEIDCRLAAPMHDELDENERQRQRRQYGLARLL